MAKRFGKPWMGDVRPREGIVEATVRQLDREGITGKLIHLCFSCDPYPAEIDTTPTREIIKAIKAAGNNVQILTKGGFRAERDFDLLDGGDRFGVSYAGLLNCHSEPNAEEPGAAPDSDRLISLAEAKGRGIGTWISCEPVLNAEGIYQIICFGNYIHHFKIGKLNYEPSDINWLEFGKECERLCRAYGRDYYIKDDLRKEMG